jgi:hypothetical protein
VIAENVAPAQTTLRTFPQTCKTAEHPVWDKSILADRCRQPQMTLKRGNAFRNEKLEGTPFFISVSKKKKHINVTIHI